MSARRARADAATVDRRVDTIATLILQGETTSKIYRNASIRRWKLTNRTIDEYIRKAREEIRARGEFDKVDEFGKAIARLEHLYSIAVEDRNVAEAISKSLILRYSQDEASDMPFVGTATSVDYDELRTGYTNVGVRTEQRINLGAGSEAMESAGKLTGTRHTTATVRAHQRYSTRSNA